MLDRDQQSEILSIVVAALDEAETIWRVHGDKLVVESSATRMRKIASDAQTVPSRIPGHKLVRSDRQAVDMFIALVADMRESSKHLLCAISDDVASVSQLQRVYYETSALLPALEKTISYKDGSVTEYLGDGVLALFQVNEGSEANVIRKAHKAASNCINVTRRIVNDELHKRYRLPEIDIGIGLGISEAIVTLVGLEDSRHAKAIGRCIYNATKLSCGRNEVYIDERMNQLWPTSQGGKLKFHKIEKRGVKGFSVKRS